MRNYCIIVVLFWLFCLPIQSAQAQISNALTVEESVKMGLEHSYRLQAAEADAEEAEAVFRGTRSSRFPSIRGQASYMRLSDNIPEVDFSLPGTDTTYTILPVELDQFHTELGIEQLLFAGGRLNNQIEAASHQASAAELAKEQQRVDVAYQVRQAYWNLYRAQVADEVLESALKRVDEHLQNVRNKMEAGTVLQTDLLNAKTRRSEVLLDRVDSESRVQVARLELNRLLGLPAEAEIELIKPGDSGARSFAVDKLTRRALQQRPELQALSEQVGAREAQVNAVQSEWFPEISLVGRYIYARPNQYFFAQQNEFRGTWEAGVQLRWNLWSGGQRFAETSRARSQLQKAEAQLADKREQVAIDISRQYLELQRALKAIDVSENSVAAAAEAYESASRQFREGVILSEQVLDAEHAYRNAQARHAEAIADYEIEYASVLHALGQIWGENDGN